MVAPGLRCLLVWLIFCFSAVAETEVEKNLALLGSSDFQDRKKASSALWELGRSAVASLEIAAASEDVEISRRAAVLLNRINHRITPDSPSDIISLVDRFSGLGPKARIEALKKLVEAGHSYAFLKLWSQESDSWVKDDLESQVPNSLNSVLQESLKREDIAECEELILLFPDHPNAPSWLANFHMMKGELFEKIVALEEAGEESPLLLACYRRSGDLDKALALAKRLGKEDAIASLSLLAGDGGPYLSWFEKLNLKKRTQKSAIKVVRLQYEEQWDEALSLAKSMLKEANESNSNSEREFIFRQLCLTGYFELALDSMEKHESYILSGLYQNTFETEKWWAKYTLPSAEKERKEWQKKRVSKIIASGDYQSEEARDIFYAVSKQHTLGNLETAREILAPLELASRKSGEEHWEKFLKRTPFRIRYSLLLASVEDDWEEEDYLNILDQFYLSDSEDKMLFWNHLERQKDLSDRQRFDVIVTFFGWNSSDRKVRNENWRQLIERGRKDDELLDFVIRKGINMDPLSIVGEAMLARSHRFEKLGVEQQWETVRQFVLLRDWDRVLEFLDTMDDPEKQSPGLVAGIFKRSGREEEGEQILSRAALRAIADPTALGVMADELEQAGCVSEASKLRLRIAMEMPPYSPVWRGNLTTMLTEAERGANRSRARAMSLALVLSHVSATSWGSAHDQLEANLRLKLYQGLDLIDEGNSQEGRELIEQAMSPIVGTNQITDSLIWRIDPRKYPELYDEVFEKSYQRMIAAVERYPHYAHVRNAVAWLCAIAERRLEEARQHSLISIEKYPSGNYYDTLARIHRGLGNREEEVKWQEYAVKHATHNYYANVTSILNRYDWILENP